MMNFKCLSWPENYLKRVVTDTSSEQFHTNRDLSYTRAFPLALWQGSGGIYNSPVTDGALTKSGQKEQRCGSAHRVSSVISSSCSEDNTRCVCVRRTSLSGLDQCRDPLTLVTTCEEHRDAHLDVNAVRPIHPCSPVQWRIISTFCLPTKNFQ